MNSQNTKTNRARRVVVIGGSMAGLLSAKVLSKHFDRVTVIERDSFPDSAEPRTGTPQARHVHVLLARGMRSLEAFFPGLRADMLAEGALEIKGGSDIAWLNPAGWGVTFTSSVKALSFSRSLLDWVVRRHLSAIPNIEFLENREVTELLINESGDCLTGVAFRNRSGDAQDEEWRASDLIVDASGRASKTPHWLAALGCGRPAETVVNAHLGYASRVYQIPDNFEADWKGIFVQAAPPKHCRGGLLFPIEGNRWLVTLVGGDRDYPSNDEDGFLQFARSLRSSIIYDAIKSAEPLTPIAVHRGTENRRRHYEQMSRLPDGLVVVGDGACAFNPVYGQGMTTSALGAELLDRCLEEQLRRNGMDLTGLGRRFQQELAKVNADPWMLSTGEDYRYLNAEGGAPNRLNRFMHRYVDQIQQLITYHPGVRQSFLEVQGMLKPPQALFAPGIVIRVLGNLLRNLFRLALGRSAQATGQSYKMAMTSMRHKTSPPGI